MKVRYLLDENLSPRLKRVVLRYNSKIDIVRVGDPDTPPLGTADLDILHDLYRTQRVLVTANRVSMPEHLQDYWATGKQLWGLFWIRKHTHPHSSSCQRVVFYMGNQ